MLERKVVQRHRINRVVNFMQNNLHRELDLYDLADVAYFSKYHFIRVFDDYLGQTPLRYLQRIRLERAAHQLIFLPTDSVGKIAERCGFTSHHSFSRAYKRYFLHSPNEHRALNTKADPDMAVTECVEVCRQMQVRVETRQPLRIAYIRHFGAYEREKGGISESASLLRDWAKTRGFENQIPLMGLCYDNRRITPTHFCTYDIGIPVPQGVDEDEIVSIITIPEGRYAVGQVKCRNEQLISAWDWLCSTWREYHAEPYQQRWNYEVFTHSSDGYLNPMQGVDLCLRLSD